MNLSITNFNGDIEYSDIEAFSREGDFLYIRKENGDLIKVEGVVSIEIDNPLCVQFEELPYFGFESISPKKANDILKKRSEDSFKNRNINKERVRLLRNQIMNNDFDNFNTESIRIDKDDILIDGQHRLTAISQSGNDILCGVFRNVNRSAFKTIDRGKPRSDADILTCSPNYSNVKGIKFFPAITYRIVALKYENTESAFSSNVMREGYKYLLREGCHGVEQFISEKFSIEEYENAVSFGLRGKMLINLTSFSVWYLFASRYNKLLAEEFAENFISGENLEKGMPEMALRQSLYSLRTTMGSCVKRCIREFYALTVAWNYKVIKKPLKLIQYHKNRHLPKMIGFPYAYDEED